MKKNLVTVLLALALAVSLAAPAGAKKDEGAEIRWLDIELPEAVLEHLDAYYVSYVEELGRLTFRMNSLGSLFDTELAGYDLLVYDLRDSRETDVNEIFYLSDDLLVEVDPEGNCRVLDLKGREIEELDGHSPVESFGEGVYIQGDAIFNGQGKVLARGSLANDSFSRGDGYIAVRNDSGKAGVIDARGDQVLPFRYDSVAVRSGCEGLFSVTVDGATGVVDAAGKTVVPFTEGMDRIESYKGLTAVNYGGKDKRAEVYDRDGKLVLALDGVEAHLSCHYRRGISLAQASNDRVSDAAKHPNADGYIYIYHANKDNRLGLGGYYSIYDRDGKLVVPEDDVDYIGIGGAGFSGGIAVVRTPEGAAIVDKTGGYVVSPGTYDTIERLGEDVFVVEKDGEAGVIDGAGKTVVKPEAGSAVLWGDYGCCALTGDDGAVRCFVNEDGGVFRPEETLYLDLSWDNGFCRVCDEPSESADRRWGVVDANRGELLVDPVYEAVRPCQGWNMTMFGKYFLVSDGERVGLVKTPRFAQTLPAPAEPAEEDDAGFPWVWVGVGVGGAAVLIAVVAAVVVAAKKKKKAKPAAVVPPAPPVTPVTPVTPAAEGPRFCTACGAAVAPGSSFCRNCGKKI